MDNNYHLDLSLPDNSRSQALSAESFSYSRSLLIRDGCASEHPSINREDKDSREAAPSFATVNGFEAFETSADPSTDSSAETSGLKPYFAYGIVDHHTAPALLGGFEDSSEIHERMYHLGVSAIQPNQISDDSPYPIHLELGFHLKF